MIRVKHKKIDNYKARYETVYINLKHIISICELDNDEWLVKCRDNLHYRVDKYDKDLLIEGVNHVN
tara:strand:- start:924 stop:1121 length:198 start_codon:yes stop_codon:yes gene_type:complete